LLCRSYLVSWSPICQSFLSCWAIGIFFFFFFAYACMFQCIPNSFLH
jgi:hypothetical protein